MYLSSVGSEASDYYDQLLKWLDEESAVRLVFQPGTMQISQGVEELQGIYRRTEDPDLQPRGGRRDRRGRSRRPCGHSRFLVPTRTATRRGHGRLRTVPTPSTGPDGSACRPILTRRRRESALVRGRVLLDLRGRTREGSLGR